MTAELLTEADGEYPYTCIFMYIWTYIYVYVNLYVYMSIYVHIYAYKNWNFFRRL
jgi:hypothetical protein